MSEKDNERRRASGSARPKPARSGAPFGRPSAASDSPGGRAGDAQATSDSRESVRASGLAGVGADASSTPSSTATALASPSPTLSSSSFSPSSAACDGAASRPDPGVAPDGASALGAQAGLPPTGDGETPAAEPPGGPAAPVVLSLRGVGKRYDNGELQTVALQDANVDIRAGEFIAIVGQSGSGKSTLLNILGCLDSPSMGTYRVDGRDVGQMEPDELAALRREKFGFIFQRYHLMGEMSALRNVEVPAVYAGMAPAERSERARELLEALGLGDKADNKPGQLSGGQQQRASICRALMNGGSVIFADEPTGALDSRSGAEVLAILKKLNAEGHTVVLVTHDMGIAQNAHRVIEIRDGRIARDARRLSGAAGESGVAGPLKMRRAFGASSRAWEAFRMAGRAIVAHKMRSFLTMLGIIIGTASVSLISAIGSGAERDIIDSLSGLGTNTIHVYRGVQGRRGSFRSSKLSLSDMEILGKQPFVRSISPEVNSGGGVTRGSVTEESSINGVGASYFEVEGMKNAKGRFFGENEVAAMAPVAVIDEKAERLFFKADEDPIGKKLIVGGVPMVVIGVSENGAFDTGSTPELYLPYKTVMSRMTGVGHLRHIGIRLKDGVNGEAAETAIRNLLTRLHGKEDFTLMNSDALRKTIEDVVGTQKAALLFIGVIALIVGGIGVMNIMLVSVAERTQEIGVRMAVGARQADILSQFLIEAILICLLGGALGTLLAYGLGAAVSSAVSQISVVFSPDVMALSASVAAGVGLVFGYWPAKSAARLDPVEALSRE